MGLFIDLTDDRSRSKKAKNAKKNSGWSKSDFTHTKSGNPIVPIVHKEYLDYLSYEIEDAYLSRNIYPGARLYHSKLGEGTVISCRLQKPHFFAFLPDSELNCEENGILQLKFYDPHKLHDCWQFPVRGCEDWQPLEVDADEDVLHLNSIQAQSLAHLAKDASTWQLGHAIKWLVDELRERTK